MVFTTTGEVIQVCRAMGIKCLCIQASEEAARALVDLLDLKEPEGLEEEKAEESTEEEDTQDILRDLSEVEKMVSGLMDGKGTKKTLGFSVRTRSKGGSQLHWSKSINPDKPIS